MGRENTPMHGMDLAHTPAAGEAAP